MQPTAIPATAPLDSPGLLPSEFSGGGVVVFEGTTVMDVVAIDIVETLAVSDADVVVGASAMVTLK